MDTNSDPSIFKYLSGALVAALGWIWKGNESRLKDLESNDHSQAKQIAELNTMMYRDFATKEDIAEVKDMIRTVIDRLN